MTTTSNAGSWNDQVIEQFLAGAPRIADMFDRDALLLLDTVGARTGQARTSPVMYLTDGDGLVIVASKAGADTNPAWYANLLATPKVTVRRWVDGDLRTEEWIAAPTEGAERDRLWNRVVAVAPGFGDYQTKTSRVIPVVALHRP
jgi:deazaflavin-dependent oxidoreductase (nitroreductase family)